MKVVSNANQAKKQIEQLYQLKEINQQIQWGDIKVNI
jgi:hypothetical protein